jgi:hypothetical protein
MFFAPAGGLFFCCEACGSIRPCGLRATGFRGISSLAALGPVFHDQLHFALPPSPATSRLHGKKTWREEGKNR